MLDLYFFGKNFNVNIHIIKLNLLHLIKKIMQSFERHPKRVVFPEGNDERVTQARNFLLKI